MRGEKANNSKEDTARQLITDAAVEAQVVLATAERKRYASTAVIMGHDGTPLFHIVSTWWSRIVVIGYGVMLAIIMLMAVLVYYNGAKLTVLEEKVDDTERKESLK